MTGFAVTHKSMSMATQKGNHVEMPTPKSSQQHKATTMGPSILPPTSEKSKLRQSIQAALPSEWKCLHVARRWLRQRRRRVPLRDTVTAVHAAIAHARTALVLYIQHTKCKSFSIYFFESASHHHYSKMKSKKSTHFLLIIAENAHRGMIVIT